MTNNIEIAYIFKKINIFGKYVYSVIDIVSGKYDVDNQVFISNNGMIYKYLLFASNEGFALRNIIDNREISYYKNKFLLNNNNYFYYDMVSDKFILVQLFTKKIFKDIDLDIFNDEYKKMCKDIFENDGIIKNRGYVKYK